MFPSRGPLDTPKFIVSFLLKSEFVVAQQFCETFKLKVSYIEFLGDDTIIFFDHLECLIFCAYANNKFITTLHSWF